MSKKEDVLIDQLREAVEAVRADHAGSRQDWYLGAQSGASAVMVKFNDIRRRDEEMKRNGVARGSA